MLRVTKVSQRSGCSVPMLKPAVLFMLLTLISPLVVSQSLVMENNPATLRWNQISTDHFRVIFPEGFEQEGTRVANTLQHLHGPASATLGKQPRPIPVILQNQGVVSNGFVALGPRRSEFFTSPPQDYKFLGNNDWLNLLATHEYRHIVQFDKSLTGVSEAAYWLFGEDVLSVLAFISTPLWLWEGDAVGIETALSTSGRGRIPYFQALHRANVMDRGGFKYQKQYLRSYKHQVPNHYLTGYLMTTFLRRTYGDDILAKVTERSFRWPIIPFTFSRALKKETGFALPENYRLMSHEMDSLYRLQVAGLNLTAFAGVHDRNSRAYTEYAYPQRTGSGTILALRYGIGDIAQLVELKEGDWKVRHTLGVWDDSGYMTHGGGKVAWNEIFFHPRWQRTTYSGIRVFDVDTGNLTTLGRHERYKGAGLSPDGRLVVTVEASEQNTFRVLVLDAADGSIVTSLPNPGNFYYSMPRFSADGMSIVLLKHAPPHKSIVSIDLASGAETEWLTSSTENLGHPSMTENWLFYASDLSGIDNIYALELASGNRFQVTSSRLGAYNHFVDAGDQRIYYNEMTKDGWDVVTASLDPQAWTPLEKAVINPVDYFQPLVNQENNANILTTVPDTQLPVEQYHQYKHLLRPYGWGWVNTLSDRQIELGLYSKNILSTAYVDAGYVINLNEGTGYWSANASYQGLPVVIDAGLVAGTRSAIQEVDDENRIYTWDEKGVNAGLRVPLNLTHSGYVEKASIGASVSSTRVQNYSNPVFDIDQQRNGDLYAVQYRADYSRLLKQSKRDIYPKWGQSVSMVYFDTPFRGGDYFSSLWSAEAYLYLPGLLKHHSLRLRGAYQNEEVNNYRFKSEVQYVRGYSYTSFRSLTTLSANYALPLLYPDLSVGPLLNLQRLRANAFYDYAHGSIPTLERNFSSIGVDLFADFNVMRYLPEMSAGVRVTYVPEQDTYLFNILFGSLSF